MTDSFFDFSDMSKNADRSFEEEDDTDYDALNSETFGENIPATNWEEVHAQLASELENRSFDDENNELCERVASSILDDESDDITNPTSSNSHVPQKTSGPLPGPLKWWPNGVPQNTAGQSNQGQPGPSNIEPWWQKPQQLPYSVAESLQMPPKPSKQHMNPMQNGNYGRGRGPPRGRYRPDMVKEQPYHAVHHPYPPYPGGPSMGRPPLRHPGPAYPRYYDGRMMVTGPMRHPRPPNHLYFPNQNKAYGRGGQPQRPDEYAGLMSQQEKQWLASIQMMQLNTSQPFQDDYYNMMYQQRQGCSGRKICGAHNQMREQMPQKPAATYTPLQFENSLGKLQIGSVTAPRKIIDMELVESLDHNAKQSDKKSKQILLEIEEMFNYVIQIEDSFNPLNTSKEAFDIVALQEKLLSKLTPEGKLVQIMSIRKGKKAVLRMLPNLLFPAALLHRLLMDLVPITRKDTENNMLLFLPAIRHYLLGLSLKTLVEITNNYDNQFLLSNKFTVSVMANLIERADQVRSDCTEQSVLNEWNLFLIRLVESTRYWNHTERPVVAVDRAVLVKHLSPVMDQVTEAEVTALLNTLQPASYTTATTGPKPHSTEDKI